VSLLCDFPIGTVVGVVVGGERWKGGEGKLCSWPDRRLALGGCGCGNDGGHCLVLYYRRLAGGFNYVWVEPCFEHRPTTMSVCFMSLDQTDHENPLEL
jgi:hypothetical protein